MTAEDIAPQFLIGEVSRAVGVSPQTLRLWEREGLIKAWRTEKGYRAYGEADVERLQRIKRLRQFEGLNYAAIRKHLGPAETVPRRNGSGSSNGSTDSDGSGVLGERLRSLRLKARKTLKEVSETTGLSISFISTLERGGTGASVASLRQLAQGYGMTMRELFGAELNQEHLLVRQADRPVMRWDNDVCFEEMASEGWLMNPSYIKVPPDTGSGGFYSHDGEEFVHVVSGTLYVELKGQGSFRLARGDTLYFPSNIPHRWWAEEAPAEAVHVNTPPTF